MITVESIGPNNFIEVDRYLAQHEETAQFLINNLSEHGPTLTDHSNSGNFKLVRAGSEVSAVFCLARRGNLIVQSDKDFSDLILSSCKNEPVALRGFIGPWESIEPIWSRFKTVNPDYKPSYESREILYSYELLPTDAKLCHDSRVRFLTESDYDQWLDFGAAYMSELALPDDLTVEQKRTNFLSQIESKIWWGLFSGEEMVSRCALNSKGKTIGQVGGVFTPKEHRQRGFAKAAMFHMLKDCRDLHGHEKNILFTGEADFPAQKLYESMGYRRIGSFALILG
ncbi:MAG: GNAT family N-acetyltransferase [Bdellovibrionales bacterium]